MAQNNTQEVRAYVCVTFAASQELDANALLAEIEDDIGRLTDGQEGGRVEASGICVVAVHEERDIYGTDGMHRESPFELLCKVENGLAADNPLREEIALSLGSTVDTPVAVFHNFIVRERFETHEEVHTGKSLRLTMPKGAYIWATGAQGDGPPSITNWMLGVYPPPEADGSELDPIWTMSCSHNEAVSTALIEAKVESFIQTVGAAKATLIAAYGGEL